MLQMLCFVILPALAGGLVQGISGFGCGIVIMLFLPIFLPMGQASAVSQCASVALCVMMVYSYRKYLNIKLCLLPWIFYFPIFYGLLSLSVDVDVTFLKSILGLFLVCLSVYCIRFADRFAIKANIWSALVCAGLSALVDVFFGLGGPPMVVYFLAIAKSKEEYIGTIQTFFCVTCSISTILRIWKGQITTDLVPVLCLTIASLILGTLTSRKFVSDIDTVLLKKMVYGFVGVAGAITFFTNLPLLMEMR